MGDGYPRDWDQRRKYVYRRDDHQCQRCGRRGGPRGNVELHAHHRIPNSEGGSHQPSNLVTVCKSCHEQIHGHAVGGAKTPSTTRSNTNSKSGSSVSSSSGTGHGSDDGFIAFLCGFMMYLLGGSLLVGIGTANLQILGVWGGISVAVAVGTYSKLNSFPWSTIENIVKIIAVLAYLKALHWVSFGVLSGTVSFFALIYFNGMFFLVGSLLHEIGVDSSDDVSTDSIDDKEIGLSIGGYFILGPLSWPVSFWLWEHIVDTLNIIAMAESRDPGEPTPVSWVIETYLAQFGAVATLSLTILSVYLYRQLADSVAIAHWEKWGIVIIQVLILSYGLWKFEEFVGLARDSPQIELALMFLAVVFFSVIWTTLVDRLIA